MIIGFNLTFGPMHILGPAGHDPPGVHVPGVARAHVLERGLHDRRVHDRAVDPGVHHQRGADAHARTEPLETTTRGMRARSSGSTASPAARLQLRRDPDRALARRVLAPQVRRGQERAARAACRRAPRTHADAAHAHGTAHAIHLPEPLVLAARGRARAADHRPTASSTRGGSSALGVAVTLVGLYGWALEPSVAE